MRHPFQSILLGWIVAIGMIACFHRPHQYKTSEANRPSTAAGFWNGPQTAQPDPNPLPTRNRPGQSAAVAGNGDFGFERPIRWENEDPNEESSEGSSEAGSSNGASEDGAGLITSRDHSMLNGLEIEQKYFPLVRNSGNNRKYRTDTGNVSYEDDGQKTKSGEYFNPEELVAAHSRYPMGSIVRCTNLSNGKSVVVQIIDRGPFVEGRILDLSEAAGRKIGLITKGVTRCRVEVLAYPQKK